ncbi:MAG: X-Pro aminopeptidase, partial [Flavobacteriales bacterium]|nr:X-Pro aminopeptidase [Flavobacteriales bacterium]
MENIDLNSGLYIKNRNKYLANTKSNSLSIFHSNDQMPTNADGLMPFRQNNNLLYLCGIDQEETALILFPDCKKLEFQEVLFIKKTSELIKIWEGEKLTKQQASEVSGIKTVFWIEDFDSVIQNIITGADYVYLSHNDHPRAKIIVESRNNRLGRDLKSKYPNKSFLESSPIINEIRSVKELAEVNTIKHACDITKSGFNRILKFIKPGLMEYNIEAELIHEFKNNKSKGFAYEPIIASGKNACVLHYTSNNQKILDGDIILMDF